MYLGRAPLIHPSSCEVPKPVHCDDLDISETSITPRPMDEVTDMSASLAHIEVYNIFRRLFRDNGAHMSSYEYIRSIDEEIQQAVSCFPWYFQVNHEANLHRARSMDIIFWQHEILHIDICLKRIRLNRPFLHAGVKESWIVCARAAQELLVPYRQMREANVAEFLGSQRFIMQAYEAYTAAVAVAAFLLVERSLPGFPSQSMIRDIEMVISDLEKIDLRPMLADGVKVLRKMLRLFEQDHAHDLQARASLTHEIATVFGGEQHASKYFKQFRYDYDSTALTTVATPILPPADGGEDIAGIDSATSSGLGNEAEIPSIDVNVTTSFDFQVALDMLSFDQWLDYMLPETTVTGYEY